MTMAWLLFAGGMAVWALAAVLVGTLFRSPWGLLSLIALMTVMLLGVAAVPPEVRASPAREYLWGDRPSAVREGEDKVRTARAQRATQRACDDLESIGETHPVCAGGETDPVRAARVREACDIFRELGETHRICAP